MKRVLLILAASRVSRSCVDDALATAERENAELVALFILDTVGPRDVGERVSHEGFLGEAPSERLLRALRRERKRQGMLELGVIAGRAERRGIAHRTDLVEGDFLTRALEAAQSEAAEVIFVARRDRPALSRLVSGSQVDELRAAVKCKVMIHDGSD